MKKHVLTYLLIAFCFSSYSQIIFEPGYFINNEGEKTECLIKNQDWKYNPLEFQYKLTETSEVLSQNIEAVREFEVTGLAKYLRATVNIDKSSDNYNRLSKTQAPEFMEQQVFLKTLVEGKATLFYYEELNLMRYFIKTEEKGIEQLVYKKYFVTQEKIGENVMFKKQLRDGLPCGINSITDLHELEYKTRPLINYFVAYHNCLNETFREFDKRQGKVSININIRPRLNVASLKVKNGFSNPVQLEFDSKIVPSLGLELEMVLPFNKNKWALIFEPTYTYFNSSDEWTYIQTAVESRTTTVFADYSSFEMPFGFRYYVFFNEDSKAFVNASLVLTKTFSSTLKAARIDLLDLEINTDTNLAFGLGYKYKDRASVEFRIHTHKDLLSDYFSWTSAYITSSLIIGYTLF